MLLILCAVIFPGCQKENISPYKVVDSGIWTYPEGLEKTFWLDNERALFISSKNLLPEKSPKFIKIWNTKTGQVDSSHEVTHLLCVQDGQVFFAAKDEATGKRTHYRGPLDNPKEYPAPGPNMWLDDRFDCGWVPTATWRTYPDRFPYMRKLRGENYLKAVDPKTKTSKGKSVYYPLLNSKGKEMPLYFSLYSISYSEFLDAYVVDKGMYDPANPEMRSFWILGRDGSLKEVPFPHAMLKGRLTIYPLKHGYLADYNSGKYTNTDPGDRGLWLMDGDKALRLIVGAIHGISVSPDGCHVAFIHARNSKEYFSQTKPYRTVKTINFCEGGGKS